MSRRTSNSASTRPGALLRKETLRKGRKWDFVRITVAGQNGKKITREVVDHPGAVVIIPLRDDGRLVMVRAVRPAVGREMLEFPAGTLEPPEPPRTCAKRELKEETGYSARRLTPLGTFYTTPGLTNERMHAFLADGLTEGEQELEEDESLTVQLVPVEQALKLVDAGKLTDGKSIAALLLALRRGLLPTGTTTRKTTTAKRNPGQTGGRRTRRRTQE